MDALEAIRNRRSVRSYTGAPVARDDLETIVDAGRLAATGYNRQPCDFIVITDSTAIDQLTVVAAWLAQAGAVIALVVDTSAEYWLEDAAAAVENMLIAATALGYGSCWLEGGTKRHEAELKALLHVPEAKRLLTLVPIGASVSRPTHNKRSLEEVIHWETY